MPSHAGSPEQQLPAAGAVQTRHFYLLWLGILISRFGLLVPAFLTLYLAGEHLATGATIGLIIGLGGAGQTCAALLGGVLADRLGPRRVILLSQLAVVALSIALMFTREIHLLAILVFFCSGFSSVHRPAAFALVTALVPAQRRVHAYGRLHWSRNVGGSLAPIVAGLLLEKWPPALFGLSAVTSLGYAILALTLPAIGSAERGTKRGFRGVLRHLADPFRIRFVAWFLVLSFVLSCVYMQKQGALPLVMQRAGLSSTQFGVVFGINAICVVVVQPFVVPLVARIPGSVGVASAAILVGIGFGANLVASTQLAFACAVVIWSCGEILLVPLSAAFMAEHAPPGRVGVYQGSYDFVWNLGLVAGPPIGQLVLEYAGATALWTGTLVLGTGVGLLHVIIVLRRRS